MLIFIIIDYIKNINRVILLHRRPWSMMLLMMSGDLATEAVIHTGRTGIWIFHDSSAYAITVSEEWEAFLSKANFFSRWGLEQIQAQHVNCQFYRTDSILIGMYSSRLFLNQVIKSVMEIEFKLFTRNSRIKKKISFDEHAAFLLNMKIGKFNN